MARINLLPWRAELRKQKRNAFFTVLGIAAVAAALGVGALQWYFVQRIDYQASRNTYLETELAKIAKKIEEIKDLAEEKERLTKRIQAIQDLQAIRPLEVRLFDEIVNTLPDGVFIREIDQQGATLTVKGTAQSQSRVSNYMRNIEASKWVSQPYLEVVQTTDKDGNRLSDFTLRLNQVLPVSDEDKMKKDGKKTGKSDKDAKPAKKTGA